MSTLSSFLASATVAPCSRGVILDGRVADADAGSGVVVAVGPVASRSNCWCRVVAVGTTTCRACGISLRPAIWCGEPHLSLTTVPIKACASVESEHSNDGCCYMGLPDSPCGPRMADGVRWPCQIGHISLRCHGVGVVAAAVGVGASRSLGVRTCGDYCGESGGLTRWAHVIRPLRGLANRRMRTVLAGAATTPAAAIVAPAEEGGFGGAANEGTDYSLGPARFGAPLGQAPVVEPLVALDVAS